MAPVKILWERRHVSKYSVVLDILYCMAAPVEVYEKPLQIKSLSHVQVKPEVMMLRTICHSTNKYPDFQP